MATYTFGLNTNHSHLVITTPSHSYAVPYVDLSIQAPQMPSGQEQVIVSNNGQAIVAVPFASSNLVGATWQDKLDDLVQNYLYMGVGSGGGTPVQSVTAGAGITLTGTATDPIVAQSTTGVVAGSYTNASLTVDARGNLTAAASGTAPVTAVTGTAPIVSSGGATPAISLANTTVAAGSYTSTNLTVDAQGRITAASNGGGGGGVTTMGPVVAGAAANAAVITGTTLNMYTGTSTTHGVGHVQTSKTTNAAVGVSAFPTYLTGTSTHNTTIGASSMGSTGAMQNSANDNTAVGYLALQGLTGGIQNTVVGSNAGTSNTAQNNNTFVGWRAGWTAQSTQAVIIGAGAGQADNTTNSIFVGYLAGNNHTTGTNNIAIGASAYSGANTGNNNTFVGNASATLAAGATQNTGMGSLVFGTLSSGNSSVAMGYSALSNATTGSRNIGIGASCTLAAAGNSDCIVIGASTVGNGSNTTTIGTAYIPSAVGTSFLKYDTATGAVTRDVSSLRYKTLLPDAPPVDRFVHRLFDLTPRAYTVKGDPTNSARVGYIAEEVERIVGPRGNPVFGSLLIYTMLDDPDAPPVQKEQVEYVEDEFAIPRPVVTVVETPAKKRAVESINYAGFVVPLIELCKQQQQQIDALTARLDAAGIP